MNTSNPYYSAQKDEMSVKNRKQDVTVSLKTLTLLSQLSPSKIPRELTLTTDDQVFNDSFVCCVFDVARIDPDLEGSLLKYSQQAYAYLPCIMWSTGSLTEMSIPRKPMRI